MSLADHGGQEPILLANLKSWGCEEYFLMQEDGTTFRQVSG